MRSFAVCAAQDDSLSFSPVRGSSRERATVTLALHEFADRRGDGLRDLRHQNPHRKICQDEGEKNGRGCNEKDDQPGHTRTLK